MKNNLYIIKNNFLNNLKIKNFYNKKYNNINIINNNLYNKFIIKIKKFFFFKSFVELKTPQIEQYFYNFKLLNILKKDNGSFYLQNKILRTHTSCFQNRFLKNYFVKNNYFNLGKVYRNDLDSTHLICFYQLDFFIYNYKIKNVLNLLLNFFSFFIKKKFFFKIRKTKFPFTINSFEIDLFNNFEWLELAGFGETNINILLNNKINYKTIAGGIGVDRLFFYIKKLKTIKKVYD
ncbi:hypothetical protein [Candidatus Carsonella ruddii]|uniref:tRNA ligase subunit PheS family protein n=1 Tax=Carsonella ruddii TaxID=114186 RepID=UPI00191554C1